MWTNVEPTLAVPKPAASTSPAPTSASAPKAPVGTLTLQAAKAPLAPNVTKITTVPVNWRVKTPFALILAVLCPVVKMPFASQSDTLLGVDAKMVGKRTRRLENASVNVKE